MRIGHQCQLTLARHITHCQTKLVFSTAACKRCTVQLTHLSPDQLVFCPSPKNLKHNTTQNKVLQNVVFKELLKHIHFILTRYSVTVKWYQVPTHESLKNHFHTNTYYPYLTQCQKVRKWWVRFLTVNKICFKHFVLLLLCVCVYNWSVSQWKQYELQIWSSWRKNIF